MTSKPSIIGLSFEVVACGLLLLTLLGFQASRKRAAVKKGDVEDGGQDQVVSVDDGQTIPVREAARILGISRARMYQILRKRDENNQPFIRVNVACDWFYMLDKQDVLEYRERIAKYNRRGGRGKTLAP